jgi:hypothetical protein
MRHIHSVVLFQLVLSCAVPAAAQAQVPQSSLSSAEKAAVGTILDSLTTKAGDLLREDVLHQIDGLAGGTPSTLAVVGAVKMGAGAKLPVFQSILVSRCLAGGGQAYCRLAALPGPQSESNGVQTAAVGASGDSGGLSSGFGGGQSNQGHNSDSGSSNSRSVFSGEAFQFPSLGNLSAGSNTGRRRFFAFAAPDPLASPVVAVAVPAPTAGSGLLAGGVLIGLAWMGLGRRRAKFGVAAKPE